MSNLCQRVSQSINWWVGAIAYAFKVYTYVFRTKVEPSHIHRQSLPEQHEFIAHLILSLSLFCFTLCVFVCSCFYVCALDVTSGHQIPCKWNYKTVMSCQMWVLGNWALVLCRKNKCWFWINFWWLCVQKMFTVANCFVTPYIQICDPIGDDDQQFKKKSLVNYGSSIWPVRQLFLYPSPFLLVSVTHLVLMGPFVGWACLVWLYTYTTRCVFLLYWKTLPAHHALLTCLSRSIHWKTMAHYFQQPPMPSYVFVSLAFLP